MRMKLWTLPIVGVAMIFTALACGPAETDTTEAIDPDPAGEVRIVAPVKYTGVIGNKEIVFEVVLLNEIQKIELFMVGVDAPLTSTTDAGARAFNWDSAGTPDGIQEIFVRVTDTGDNTYDSAPLNVVMINGGQAAYLLEGVFGEITIPANYDGAVEVDEKVHFDMPTGMRRLVAVTNWFPPEEQELPWGIELQVGQGICPHNGTTWGGEPYDTEGPLINEVVHTTDFPQDTWFAHLRPLNPYEHLGESLPFEVRVYLLPE